MGVYKYLSPRYIRTKPIPAAPDSYRQTFLIFRKFYLANDQANNCLIHFYKRTRLKKNRSQHTEKTETEWVSAVRYINVLLLAWSFKYILMIHFFIAVFVEQCSTSTTQSRGVYSSCCNWSLLQSWHPVQYLVIVTGLRASLHSIVWRKRSPASPYQVLILRLSIWTRTP